MKIRNGFVSNSSSSSFTISLDEVSRYQFEMIRSKINELALIQTNRENEEVWHMNLSEYDFTLNIYASMDDDFDWMDFLERIDI